MQEPKFALVAGGSGALGGAICRALAAAGYDIALTYRSNAQAARSVEEQVRGLGRACESRAVALEQHGEVAVLMADLAAREAGIDAVVYAAGPHLDTQFVSAIAPSDWKAVFDTDVNGCFNLLREALPVLRKRQGAIVAVTTSATEKVPVRDILSAAPKSAIQMLVKGIAKEEGRFGIRANCVGPGFIDGGVGRHILEQNAEFAEQMRKQLPLRRFGAPEDIAGAVAFLLSPAAAYITGQSLAVDGGLQL